MPDRLERYRRKRDRERTPEPFGPGRDRAEGPLAPRPFVVQKHAARRLHWDFRLELGGALVSWAVPKGPSASPADKRMAVQTEDHPIEYADFEGVIPAGNYGAGAVIVWDRGTWTPLSDPARGLAKGELKFRLQGYKLRGEWVLVRTRRGPAGKEEWLLIKHRDAAADPRGTAAYADESVLSGRTLEEVAAGHGRAEEAAAEAARLGAPRRKLGAADEKPMLAESRDAPFDGKGWLFELKYDGYRMMTRRSGSRATLRYRSGQDATRLWPEIAKALETLPVSEALLDGEVVVLDPDGRPSFQALQGRAQLSRQEDVQRAAAERPATYFAFDLLALAGHDLRALPLAQRKALLARVVPRLGPVRYAEHIEERGEDLFREVESRGLEGIVAKKADAPYRPGRSGAWLKIRARRTEDLAVVGFTAPRGSRERFGALHLAYREGDRFVYAGSVGSGFTERQLEEIHDRIAPRARPTPPCVGPVPRGRGHVWVEPELVVEVRYTEWTGEGLLRQPVFLRLRDDKRPQDAFREDLPAEPPPPPSPAPAAAAGAASREVKVTNPEKVFFPGEGITKGDLVSYYRGIAPWMLPWMRDRPLVLTRHPDGIEGKSFFQKDAPEWRPTWMRTVTVHSEDADRDLDHFLVDDADGLAWLANLGTIPIHVWASRVGSLERPDWCVVDLDPKEAPFEHVVRLALAVHALCDEIGLPAYPKTTGQRGMHVLVPLGGQLTHAQSRALGELLARAIEARHGDVSTTARALGARGGKVYLDYLQNGYGKTIVAPYSARPKPGAPVSMPLRWREVGPKLDPATFTIRNALRRMEKLGEDPILPVITEKPDLLGALERLRGLLPVGRAAGAGNGGADTPAGAGDDPGARPRSAARSRSKARSGSGSGSDPGQDVPDPRGD